MNKLKGILSLLFLGLIVSSCSIKTKTNPINNSNNIEKINLADTTEKEVNMLDMISYLKTKNDHYPISDAFIEKYQQTSGGYLDYAQEIGQLVDRENYEPNQKWHFFTSWYGQSLDEKSINFEDSSKSKVYSNILCPELLLWIYEACGVDANKVNEASKVAEAGKVAGTNVSTIAKNMRSVVSWNDVSKNIPTGNTSVSATSVSLSNTFLNVKIGEEYQTLTATPNDINTSDVPIWKVTNGNDVIQLISSYNKVQIVPLKEGTATIRVSYNSDVFADCTVSVTEADAVVSSIVNVPNTIDLDTSNGYQLLPYLNVGEGTFTYISSNDNVIQVNNTGSVSTINNGSAYITISSVEHPNIYKNVYFEVFDHGSADNPLTVSDATVLINKLSLGESEFTYLPFYIQGASDSIPTSTGKVTMKDLTNTTEIVVAKSTKAVSVTNYYSNDKITCFGYIQKYVTKKVDYLQFNTLNSVVPSILKVEYANSTLTLGKHDNATVKYNDSVFTTINALNNQTISLEIVADSGYEITSVKNGETAVSGNNNIYTFTVTGDSTITVETAVALKQTALASYDIVYDLGTGKTAKAVTTATDIKAMFSKKSTSDIITSISQFESIWGGGAGGSSDNKWYSGNMMKIGTTSAKGNITFDLSETVNRIKITGYVNGTNCSIQVGDSSSTDFTSETNDNKTSTVVLKSMALANLTNVQGGLATSITIDFKDTKNVKILKTNAVPLFITSIEFIYVESGE